MYAHVSRWEFAPGMAEETLRRLEQQLLPLLRERADFRSHEAIKTAPDHALTISRWDSEAGALAARQMVPKWVARAASDHVVAVHTTADPRCKIVAAIGQ